VSSRECKKSYKLTNVLGYLGPFFCVRRKVDVIRFGLFAEFNQGNYGSPRSFILRLENIRYHQIQSLGGSDYTSLSLCSQSVFNPSTTFSRSYHVAGAIATFTVAILHMGYKRYRKLPLGPMWLVGSALTDAVIMGALTYHLRKVVLLNLKI
jgi:hypothetical protein